MTTALHLARVVVISEAVDDGHPAVARQLKNVLMLEETSHDDVVVPARLVMSHEVWYKICSGSQDAQQVLKPRSQSHVFSERGLGRSNRF